MPSFTSRQYRATTSYIPPRSALARAANPTAPNVAESKAGCASASPMSSPGKRASMASHSATSAENGTRASGSASASTPSPAAVRSAARSSPRWTAASSTAATWLAITVGPSDGEVFIAGWPPLHPRLDEAPDLAQCDHRLSRSVGGPARRNAGTPLLVRFRSAGESRRGPPEAQPLLLRTNGGRRSR